MATSLVSTGVTFPDGTTQTTAASGGVSSLNGQTGAITNTTYGAIGSYVFGSPNAGASGTTTRNTTHAGSGLNGSTATGGNGPIWNNSNNSNMGLSGTWRTMSSAGNNSGGKTGANYSIHGMLLVRIS